MRAPTKPRGVGKIDWQELEAGTSSSCGSPGVVDYFGPFLGDEGDGGELWKEMRDLLSVVVTFFSSPRKF